MSYSYFSSGFINFIMHFLIISTGMIAIAIMIIRQT